jgi:enamine deaminase RidA (YjgF/YER057c/UK114 family)
MSFEILNPEPLGRPKGWNNGMLALASGRVLFVAGQTARDGAGRVPALDFVSQFERALANVLVVVRAAGGDASDIGRLTIYVTSMEAYRSSLKLLGERYRGIMGRHYPAMALVEVKALVDPNALVEIEATAVIRDSVA